MWICYEFFLPGNQQNVFEPTLVESGLDFYAGMIFLKTTMSHFQINPSKILSIASLIPVGCFGLPNGTTAQDVSPEHAYAINRLEARRVYQEQLARQMKAKHDFGFVDAVLSSGVNFEHHVVDDAGLTYKAAHYDHGNAVAAADVDGDGWVDLYWTTQGGENELWRNLGKGRFENITSKAGVGLKDQISVGASFADVDNDGDVDLFVTTVRFGNYLFQNKGDGTFEDVTKASGLSYTGHSSGAVFWDYNRDGWLDLFVTNVGKYTMESQGRGGFYEAYPDAFSGHLFPERTETSILFQGMGNGKFKDVTEETGLKDGSWSGDCSFSDVNGDGFPDLYVVNMQGDDHFYLNQAGKTFVEKGSEYFPKTPWGAMGVKFFDANQDGKLDLYITDMHSDMSQGQTVEALRFHPDAEKAKSEAFCSVQWTDDYLQGASNNIFGNALYLSQSNGRYAERSSSFNAETYWPWGFSVGDLNADGFDDVFVAAGMGYPFRYGINSVLLNEGGRRFFDSEFVLGVEPRGDGRTEKVWFTVDCDDKDKDHRECQDQSGMKPVLGTLSTRSSVILDVDKDGDLDIVTNEFNDRPQILLSDLSNKSPANYLQIKLLGTTSNRDALGAMVTVTVDGKEFVQLHDGKSGYLAQSSMPLYFGLGQSKQAERIKIVWPSGKVQVLSKGLKAGKTLTVEESE
jgi:hypothetical protein